VSAPQDYRNLAGKVTQKAEIDLTARIMSMGTLHKAYAGTGAICTAGAAKIEGTVVYEALDKTALQKNEIRLGHPGGVMVVGVEMEKKGNIYDYKEGVLSRTARRLMEGYVYVPEKYFKKA
jgi:2-methylaconitate cis-trans-isomerase PrpF